MDHFAFPRLLSDRASSPCDAEAPVAHRVPVWDWAVRLFHSGLVLLVGAALLTGYFAPEWWLNTHSLLGYGVTTLVMFRLIWGFHGTGFSRFATFCFTPRTTATYLVALLRRQPPHYLGHNPAGALMVFTLLAVLSALVISGLIALGGEEKLGALAGLLSYATGHVAKELHSVLALVLVGLIALHVLGVLVESRLSRSNLPAAMLHGAKPWHGTLPAALAIPARPRRALLLVLGLLLGTGGAFAWGIRLPPYGIPELPPLPVYARACGACHDAYHPSLLPRASWQAMLNSMDDHFGEDATLSPVQMTQITAWLDQFAAESWDTEAANRFRYVADNAPLRITATPSWIRTHRAVPDSTFARKNVGGKGQCASCHRDAASGHFDDNAISIPDAKGP